MKYEERKSIISRWLIDFLQRYEIPSHLSESAIKQEMVFMVEDINKVIPTGLNEGGMLHLLGEVAGEIRRTHTVRRWPVIAQFVKAVGACGSSISSDHLLKNLKNADRSELSIHARRIQNGEPVSDYYVTGRGADELIRKSYITPDQLGPYKKSLAMMQEQK